jgi:hypothetical protein
LRSSGSNNSFKRSTQSWMTHSLNDFYMHSLNAWKWRCDCLLIVHSRAATPPRAAAATAVLAPDATQCSNTRTHPSSVS